MGEAKASKYVMKQLREFLVKWVDMSYWHCSWVTETRRISSTGIIHYYWLIFFIHCFSYKDYKFAQLQTKCAALGQKYGCFVKSTNDR